MSLDRTEVERGASEHIRDIERLQHRRLTGDEKRAIRKEHERIAEKVDRGGK